MRAPTFVPTTASGAIIGLSPLCERLEKSRNKDVKDAAVRLRIYGDYYLLNSPLVETMSHAVQTYNEQVEEGARNPRES